MSQAQPAVAGAGGPWRGWRPLAAIWILVTVAVLWMPPPPNPRLDWPWLDEAIHFVLFGGIAGLGWLAALPGRAMCIGVVALAALTELGQGLLPWDRRPDVVDFGFDLVGAALGWVLAWSLARLSQGARART